MRRSQITGASAGTNHWIWSHNAYLDFKRKQAGILWIEGKPGSGKSVLAKTIQRSLLARSTNARIISSNAAARELQYNRTRVGDWFYHGRRGGAYVSHESFLKSTLHQLLEQDPDLFVHLRDFYREEGSSGVILWRESILVKTFERMSTHGVRMICVLDALDEAENTGILKLVERLTVGVAQSQMKFIILSRTNVEIERSLRRYQHILLESENKEDIARFINRALASLSKAIHSLDFGENAASEPARSDIPRRTKLLRKPRDQIPKSVSAQEEQELAYIGQSIQDKANSTFLWVKLVFDELRREVDHGTCTFAELRRLLHQLPEELHEYYRRITTDLSRGATPQKVAFARRVLMWVSGASELQDFTLEELWDALAIPVEREMKETSANGDPIGMNRMPIRSFEEFRRKLHCICGPLIEVLKPCFLNEQPNSTTHGASSTVQLMHQTVRDFLSDERNAGNLHFYPSDAVWMVLKMSSRYVNLVGRTVPKQRHQIHQTTDDVAGVMASANLTVQKELERPSCEQTKDPGAATVDEMIDWLDDKKLLRFALSTRPQWKFRLIHPYQKIFGRSIALPEAHSSDLELVEALNDSRYLPGTGEPVRQQALTASRLFRSACNEGFVVAASNLVAIASILPTWWETDREVVKHSLMFAASEAEIPTLRLTLMPGTENLSASATDGNSPGLSMTTTEMDCPWEITLEMLPGNFYKQRYTCSSKFVGWCDLIDKVCGGKAQILRENRRHSYEGCQLPCVEDVEEAIGVVFQSIQQGDPKRLERKMNLMKWIRQQQNEQLSEEDTSEEDTSEEDTSEED